MEEEKSTPPAILIAVNDEAMRTTLAEHLRGEGYAIVAAVDGGTALQLAQKYPLLAALLDRTLPPRDGLDLCRLLRTQEETAWLPILMIAKQEDETDTVVGLEVGADDYVAWPCSWRILRARIRALVRRSRYMQQHALSTREEDGNDTQEKVQGRVLVRGELCIDLAGRTITLRDQPVHLSARLFDLLVYLARHPGIVLSRKQLMEQVHQESGGDEHVIDVYVHWLREKLEDVPAHPQRIQTVRGVGYRFTGE